MMHLQKLIISTTVATLMGLSVQAYATDSTPAQPALQPKDSSTEIAKPTDTGKKPVQTTVIPSEGDVEGAVPRSSSSRISVVNRPLIAGLWGMEIPGTSCIEYYNFMENGEVAIKSGAEWTYGEYKYQLPDTLDSGSPILAMQIKYDNLQTDCSGNAVDQSGELQQHYVKWLAKTNIQFCGTDDGKQCYINLKKVLP